MRFAVAAPLLALVGRRGLRDALTPRVLASGAIGFGAVIVLQNLGIERTSVSHAAVVIGAAPVLVALIAAGLGQTATRPLTWAGYGVALVGIALVAGAGGGGATPRGDLLVLASVVLSATFIAIQPRLLEGRDAAAVTAVQFAGGALVALPVAVLSEGVPHAPGAATPALAMAALALAGTPLPFWLFAFGQARVPAEFAGAFLNLEPVVGAAAGWLALGEPAAVWQIVGVGAVLAGVAMSTLAPKPETARRAGRGPTRLQASYAATVTPASASGRREPPAAVRAQIDQERQHHEEPLEAGHVVSRAPGPERGVCERRPREQEEPEQRQDPAVERMAENVAEDPQQDQDQPRRDQREQGEQAGHPVKCRCSGAGGRHPNGMRPGGAAAGSIAGEPLRNRQETSFR